MSVNLSFLCVFCQAIFTTSFGATLPLTRLEAGVLPIQPLSLPLTGKILPLSPKEPSRASDVLTKYLKSFNSGIDSPLPSSSTDITQNSLPQVSSRASDILFEYFKSQNPENVSSPTSLSTGNTLLSSPKVPSKASDIFLDSFKTQYSTTNCLLPSKDSFETELSNLNNKPPCSSYISLPTYSHGTKAFSTVSYPPSLPEVDIYKTTAFETHQPIYKFLPSLNSFSITSSLPTISSDALKRNVNCLNQESKLASPSYLPSTSPIFENSLPPVNVKYSLPYPLQYTLKSLPLPKVVTPPVTISSNLSSQQYFLNQELLPKLNHVLVNDKSKSFNSKTTPKVPVSPNTLLKACNIVNSDQLLRTGPVNSLQNQLVVYPLEPFPFNNLENPSSLGSRNIRPIVPKNVPIDLIDEIYCKLFHNASDSIRSINLNSNQLGVSNVLQRYSDDSLTENKNAQMFLPADISILDVPEITISDATLCAKSVPNILPDISSSTVLYVPSYTQIIPDNYLNVSPFLSLSSSYVGNILSNIIYTYLPYLISTRIKPKKSAKVLPINPYFVSKQISTTSRPSISLNPKLMLPITSQTINNKMALPLIAPSTTMSCGPSIMNPQSIDMTPLYYDFCSPSFITYSDITAPLSQSRPLVPPTVTSVPPGSFIDYYSRSQLCSHNLPSSFLPAYSEYYPPIIVDRLPIAQVKYSDKSKSVEKLLGLVCLAELIKGKGSVDWDAIEMALALLSEI